MDTSIDDLLDSTLDELEDLPSFEPPPPGAHKALATMSLKKIEGHGQAVELKFKHIETLELANDQDKTPEAGGEYSTLFLFDNEFGRGAFKKVAAPLAAVLSPSSNRELIEMVTDIEVVIMTSIRPDKNDPDRLYLNVKELAVT